MATQTDLATRLEQSLRRLAGQKNKMLTLTVSQLISTTCSAKTPVNRKDVDIEESVNIDELEHISTSTSTANGLAIRMIFDGQLYATCREDALELEEWAEDVSSMRTNQPLPPFPSIHFQRVTEKVRVRDNEITVA